MTDRAARRRKVVVVGAGAVGATFCYALAQSGLSDEIALIDRNEGLARGQVMDLVHGQPFFPPVAIHVGEGADYADAGLIVVTAGAPQRPGESRMQLLRQNAAVVRSVVEDIRARNSSAVMLIVSNPVDVMTHLAIRYSGWDRSRVIGSGTVLDSARLRHMLGVRWGVDVHNVHGYVLGEHGDSEFVAWSMTHVAGMRIDDYCRLRSQCGDWVAERRRIEQAVRNSAYHVIGYKGATSFAVGLALVRIAAAILRGQNSVLTVSSLLEGEFGLRGMCLSVPCLVSANGVDRILESPLPGDEMTALQSSATQLMKATRDLEANA